MEFSTKFTLGDKVFLEDFNVYPYPVIYLITGISIELSGTFDDSVTELTGEEHYSVHYTILPLSDHAGNRCLASEDELVLATKSNAKCALKKCFSTVKEAFLKKCI